MPAGGDPWRSTPRPSTISGNWVRATPTTGCVSPSTSCRAGSHPTTSSRPSSCWSRRESSRGTRSNGSNARDGGPVSVAEPDDLLRESEVTFEAIRAKGKGGQNVNKVSNAVHLRFDVRASSLPDPIKTRLLALSDRRITADGVVVIKAQTARSLEQNREEALARLRTLIAAAAIVPRARH